MTRHCLSKRTLCIAVLAACLWLSIGRAEAAEDWEWTFAPYFWVADMGMDMTIDDVPALGIDVKATDLLDKVELVFQAHFEGRRGRGGFFADLTYMEITDSLAVPNGPSIDADVTQILLEGGGLYRLKDESSGLELLFGVRVFEIDQVMEISDALNQTTVDVTTTMTDGFVGLRYGGPIGKKWSYKLRGDVGTGDTELTWNAIVGFGYEMGKTGKYSLVLGYRYLQFEFEEEDGGAKIESDMTFSGPAIGLQIDF